MKKHEQFRVVIYQGKKKVLDEKFIHATFSIATNAQDIWHAGVPTPVGYSCQPTLQLNATQEYSEHYWKE